MTETAPRRPAAPVQHTRRVGCAFVPGFAQARRRLEQNGCLAVMAGRGALIKPWLFQEYAEGRAFEPDARERVGIYRRLVAHMKEYFGDDARGRGKAFYFLPWHFDFLTRYRCVFPLRVCNCRSNKISTMLGLLINARTICLGYFLSK